MSLFDSTAAATSLSPLQMIFASQDQGRKAAESFNTSYNQSRQQQAQKEQQTQKTQDTKDLMDYQNQIGQQNAASIVRQNATMAEALQGVDSPEAAWQVFSQNPSWLVNPATSKGAASFLKAQTDVAKAQVGTIEGKTKIADVTDFTKRKSLLDPEDRASIDSISKNKDGTPSATAWQALGIAEQTRNVRLENERQQAGIDATKRGDQQTTTVTDKGVTQRFTPPKIDAAASPIQLQEQQLGSDKFAVNPKTGHAVKLSNPDKPLGVTELLREKRQATKDGDTATIAWIQNFVKDKYPNNAGLFGITNAPAATKPKPTTPATNPDDPLGILK